MSARLESYITPQSCATKVRLRSKRLAKKVARRAQTSLGGPAMSWFRCPWCRTWHVGHPRKAEARAS